MTWRCMCAECVYERTEDYDECEACLGEGCELCAAEGGWWYGEAMSRQEFERRARALAED